MIFATSCLRLLALTALLTGTVLAAGCSSPDKVTKTTTTEQTTTTSPGAESWSTNSTTTQKVQP